MEPEEELLQRILLGEVDPDAPESRALFEEHPEYRRRMEQARELQGALDRAGARERGDLSRASALAGVTGEEDVVSFVHDRTVGASPERRPGIFRGALAVAAAAAVLLFFWTGRDDFSGSGEELLGAGIELLEPVGEVAAFDTFRWMYALEEGGWFEVMIYHDDASGSAGQELFRARVTEETWTVPEGLTDVWPERIRWEVVPVDATAGRGSPSSARAWLSPR